MLNATANSTLSCKFKTRQLLGLGFFLWSAFLWQPQVTTAQVRVSIRDDQIQLVKQTVTIGDVADVTGTDPALIRKIRELDLDTFQSNERPALITQPQVKIRMGIAGVPMSQVSMLGPEEVLATRLTSASLRKSLASRIANQLSERYTIPRSMVHVTVDSDQPLPTDLREIETMSFDLMLMPELPLGRQSLTYSSSVGDLLAVPQDRSRGTQSTVARNQPRKINVVVALIRKLAFATRDIPAGSKLTSQNIDVSMRPVTSRKQAFLTRDQVLGKTTRNAVPAFSLIKTSDIQTEQQTELVKRDSTVNVVVSRAGLTVTLRDVKTLSGGNIGDRILLVNPNNGEKMSARIVDANTARTY